MTHHVRQAEQDATAHFLGNLASTQTLRLVITLPLRNEDELNQPIKDLYDPSRPRGLRGAFDLSRAMRCRPVQGKAYLEDGPSR